MSDPVFRYCPFVLTVTIWAPALEKGSTGM